MKLFYSIFNRFDLIVNINMHKSVRLKHKSTDSVVDAITRTRVKMFAQVHPCRVQVCSLTKAAL